MLTTPQFENTSKRMYRYLFVMKPFPEILKVISPCDILLSMKFYIVSIARKKS